MMTVFEDVLVRESVAVVVKVMQMVTAVQRDLDAEIETDKDGLYGQSRSMSCVVVR
jgi:hypothetical protein